MLLKQLRLIPVRPALANPCPYFFAKEAPKKEGGKKEEAPAPVVPEQPKMEDLIKKWLYPTHASLSPSEQKFLTEGFDDLSAADKQILDRLAQRILELPTAVLMDVIKKGALGTTNMYYTAVDPLPEEEIPGMIKHLRKEI